MSFQNLSVRPLELQFDLPAALKALEDVCERYPFSPTRQQISLTHQSADGSIGDGVGLLFNFKDSVWTAREKDFCYFNEEFKHTYFYALYMRMQEWTRGKIGRVRLMNLDPKTCYSMHRDPTIRYHFVLRSNPHSFLIFRDGQIYSLPADGRVFLVDTRSYHTAMNGGEESRIHLVMTEIEG